MTLTAIYCLNRIQYLKKCHYICQLLFMLMVTLGSYFIYFVIEYDPVFSVCFPTPLKVFLILESTDFPFHIHKYKCIIN